MIKNIIFDIGNVILNFDIDRVLNNITGDSSEQKFIMDNIYNSPEWTMYNFIDTGLLDRKSCIKLQCDRSNHKNDELIRRFWLTYNEYAYVDVRVIELIKKLRKKYKIYLLSNMNEYTFEYLKKSDLFSVVDGYIMSFEVNQVKPYEGIYRSLLKKYNLISNECIFIDDNINNIFTANKLGIHGVHVKADNYDSIINELKKLNILESYENDV